MAGSVTYSGTEGLRSLGLERAFVMFADTTPIPIVEVTVPVGSKIVEHILGHLPEGARVFADYASMIRNIPIRSH